MIKSFLRVFGINRMQYKLDKPLVVYNMGKVGSSSVFNTLAGLNLDGRIYHAHVLENLDSMAKAIKERFPDPELSLEVIEQGRNLRRLIDRDPGQFWDIITLIRDPVAQTVSRFFQSIEEVIPDIHARIDNRDIQAGEVIDIFLKRWPRQPALVWFDSQFQPVFNIEVFSHPFPRDKGYVVIKNGRFSVLIIRLEDLDACATAALEEFLGIPDIKLQRVNVAAAKWYREIYNEFKSKITLPGEYLDEMYGSKLATHFYSPEEIEKFRSRWTR